MGDLEAWDLRKRYHLARGECCEAERETVDVRWREPRQLPLQLMTTVYRADFPDCSATPGPDPLPSSQVLPVGQRRAWSTGRGWVGSERSSVVAVGRRTVRTAGVGRTRPVKRRDCRGHCDRRGEDRVHHLPLAVGQCAAVLQAAWTEMSCERLRTCSRTHPRYFITYLAQSSYLSLQFLGSCKCPLSHSLTRLKCFAFVH